MSQRNVVVGIGEILWDLFPQGPRFGGAPANFTCSASELGGDRFLVFMVGNIGRDALGKRAIQSLQDHGVDTSHVSFVDRATGQVNVRLNDGQAVYEFADDAAWDHLTWSNDLERLGERTNAVCFGTLGQRSEPSRNTIRRFISSAPRDCLSICDINLRSPFYDDAVIHESLMLANVVKLNDDELPIVASSCGLSGTAGEIITQLVNRFDLQVVALTHGSAGSVLFRDREISQRPAVDTSVVDTVGAGDAFTAALAIGLLDGHDLDQIHRTASRVAAFVCSRSGATPKIPKSAR